MEKAVLYLRVSSSRQEDEGYSLDAQEKLGREYARKNDLEIVRMWKGSESAWKEGRPGFTEMIDFMKKRKEVNHIIFDITDRTTRNDMDKIRIIRLIKEHGKTVHYSRTGKVYNKDFSSDDEFMYDIEVAVAKKMSNDISRKSKMGVREKAEQGYYPSIAPIGYLNNKATRRIDIDEERALLVRQVFELMAGGEHSLQAIVEEMDRRGLRSKSGKRVNKSGIAVILSNPFYYGDFIWNGTQYRGKHEPIISKPLFKRAKQIRTGKKAPFLGRKQFAFNNLLTCGICGCRVLGERKKGKYNYYHCSFAKGKHTGKRGEVYIPEAKLADLMQPWVEQITLPKEIFDWLRELVKREFGDIARHQEQRLGAANARKAKVEARMGRLYEERLDGELPEEMFQSLKSKYNTELQLANEEIERISMLEVPNMDKVLSTLELSQKLTGQYVSANMTDKGKILKSVASNFVLEGLSVCPVYKKPFNLIAEGLSRTSVLPRQDSNL